MALLSKPEPTASTLREQAEDNRAAYLAEAQAITERIDDRKAVVDARLRSLEAERVDLDNIQV